MVRTTHQEHGITPSIKKPSKQVGRDLFWIHVSLYTLRRPNTGSLQGILGHTAVGGIPAQGASTVQQLRKRFPYRKWRISSGEFCGAMYEKDPNSHDIVVSQKSFAESLRPATIPKEFRQLSL